MEQPNESSGFGILKIEQQTNLKEKKKNPEIPRESEVRTTESLEEQSLPKEKRSSESARVNKGIVRWEADESVDWKSLRDRF